MTTEVEAHSVAPSAIRRAQERLEGVVYPSPIVPLDTAGLGIRKSTEIYLKLECLQPIGSFKLRGAWNALTRVDLEGRRHGASTASAGNMAQGVAWSARRLGIPCRVLVPESAPRTKLAAVERLGGEIRRVPFDAWWRALEDPTSAGLEGIFVHPVCDPAVIAGNATVGLEIDAALPGADHVLVPYGGGGLACGIASSFVATASSARVWACEVETAAPLAASLEAAEPRSVEHRPSFVDGIGGKSVLAPMWPLARRLLAGSRVVSLGAVADAVRLLVERVHVVAEGAGASPVAAALEGVRRGELDGRIVCVVSGGNLDTETLAAILRGEIP